MTTQTRSYWQIQKAVLHALLVRELKTRFGQYRLGMLWAVLEPLMQIIVFVFMYQFRGTTEIGGIALPVFLATGLAPFLYFNKVISQSMGAVAGNKNLLLYRQVRLTDIFLARFILEAVTTLLSLTCLLVGVWWLGYQVTVVNSLEFVLVFSLLSFLSFGVGLVFGTANTLFPEMGKFLPLVLRPLFFISGTFFTINDMPTETHKYLLWNPLLHAFELMRSCFSPHYNTSLVSLGYLSICTLGAVTLGLLMLRANWRRMLRVR